MQKKGTMEKQSHHPNTITVVPSHLGDLTAWSLTESKPELELSPRQRNFSLQLVVMTTDFQLIHLHRIRDARVFSPLSSRFRDLCGKGTKRL